MCVYIYKYTHTYIHICFFFAFTFYWFSFTLLFVAANNILPMLGSTLNSRYEPIHLSTNNKTNEINCPYNKCDNGIQCKTSNVVSKAVVNVQQLCHNSLNLISIASATINRQVWPTLCILHHAVVLLGKKKCTYIFQTYIKEMISIAWCVENSGQCKEQGCQIMWSAHIYMAHHPVGQCIQYLW